jgi:hypothetical protein
MSTLGPDISGRRRSPTRTPAQRQRSRAAATLSVPEAGRIYFGLSKNGSYLAAGRGDLPTIRIGRKVRVPIRLLEQMIDEAGARAQKARA